jgi:hypothetical protein
MHDRDGTRYGQIYFFDCEEVASIRNADNQIQLDEYHLGSQLGP